VGFEFLTARLQLKASGILHHVDWYIVTYVSNDNPGFIDTVMQSIISKYCLTPIDCSITFKLTDYNIPEGMYL